MFVAVGCSFLSFELCVAKIGRAGSSVTGIDAISRVVLVLVVNDGG
jgi:hypothetical protein